MLRKVLSVIIVVAVSSLSIAGFAENFKRQAGDMFIMGGLGRTFSQDLSIKGQTGNNVYDFSDSIAKKLKTNGFVQLGFGSWITNNARVYANFQLQPKRSISGSDRIETSSVCYSISGKHTLKNQNLSVSADWVDAFGNSGGYYFMGAALGANKTDASLRYHAGAAHTSSHTSNTALMYGAQAGAGYNFTDVFALELGYQYRKFNNNFKLKYTTSSSMKIKQGNQQNFYLNAVVTF